MRHARSSLTGFSLVELMVVIAIAGILAAIAMPSFKSLVGSQRVKSASYELFSLLSLARSEAIKRNADVTITPTFSGTVLTGLEVASGGEIITSKSWTKGVVIDTDVAGITYKRSGRTTVTAAPVTFELDVEDPPTPSITVQCITIELSGVPRTRKGACPP